MEEDKITDNKKDDQPEEFIVSYPYAAQAPDELTLKKGDIIRIISKGCSDQGWWKGEINGTIGVFPNNFVRKKTPKSVGNAKATKQLSEETKPKSLELPQQLEFKSNVEEKPKSKPALPKTKKPQIEQNKQPSLISNKSLESEKDDLVLSELKEGKLSHLTKQRPKGPQNRRPPSLIKTSIIIPSELKDPDLIQSYLMLSKTEPLDNNRSKILRKGPPPPVPGFESSSISSLPTVRPKNSKWIQNLNDIQSNRNSIAFIPYQQENHSENTAFSFQRKPKTNEEYADTNVIAVKPSQIKINLRRSATMKPIGTSRVPMKSRFGEDTVDSKDISSKNGDFKNEIEEKLRKFKSNNKTPVSGEKEPAASMTNDDFKSLLDKIKQLESKIETMEKEFNNRMEVMERKLQQNHQPETFN